jgi:acetyl esterase
VLGGADQQDMPLQRVADEAGVVVVSVEYRLAPEHPFPAAPDDCAAAAEWVVANAASEWGTDRVVIGGESAGAHLAALTLLRLRDQLVAPDAIRAANLVFGAYDISMTPSQRNWGDANLVLSTPIMEWFGEQFLPGWSHEDRRRPEVSPLYADLAGLPPALFTVGTRDPLLDDSLFMSMRWQAAGNQATLSVYPESIHGFVAFPIAIAQASIAEQITFIAEHAGL